jgi:4-amino-4-deoxy-L-arabinose transferase-like glycosyltransferase
MYEDSFLNKRVYIRDIAGIGIVFGFLYLLFLGSHSLILPDEARYSEVTREMIASHDFITPHLNGLIFFDKPILFYWLQAIAISIGGINEWAMRIIPAIWGIFGLICTYIAGCKLYNRSTGIIAAIILASSPIYFFSAHYANMDLGVAVYITAALVCFLLASEYDDSSRPKRYVYGFYIFTALAVLTKGLIGIVLPSAIIVSWMLILQRWDIIKTMRPFTGLITFLFIVCPWFIAVQLKNPEFLYYFFYIQHVQRFLSESFNNIEPFYFYIPVILLGTLPWSFFIIHTLYHNLHRMKAGFQLYQKEIFLLLWIAIITVFFSLPKSKIIGYILPAIPPLILLIANYLHERWTGKLKKIFILVSVLSFASLIIFLSSLNKFPLDSNQQLAKKILDVKQPNTKIIMYYTYLQDIPLYLQQPVIVTESWGKYDINQDDDWATIFNYGIQQNPESAANYLNFKQFWSLWKSNEPILVLIKKHSYKHFKHFAKNATVLAENEKVLLVTNHTSNQSGIN